MRTEGGWIREARIGKRILFLFSPRRFSYCFSLSIFIGLCAGLRVLVSVGIWHSIFPRFVVA